MHANLVNDARFKTLEPGGAENSGILDVTTGPGGDRELRARDQRHRSATPSPARWSTSLFLKPQPPDGVGMQCAATDQFSYAQVEVTRNELTVDLLDRTTNPVQRHRQPRGARRPALPRRS